MRGADVQNVRRVKAGKRYKLTRNSTSLSRPICAKMHIEKFKYYYYINTKLALFVIKTDTQSIYYQTRLRLALGISSVSGLFAIFNRKPIGDVL